MKRNLKYTLLGIAYIILFSCSDSTTTEPVKFEDSPDNMLIVDNFPKETELSGEFVGPSSFFLRPSSLIIQDTLLYVIDSEREPNLFYIFSLNNFQLLASFGNRGNGPNEFRNIHFNHQLEGGNFWVRTSYGLALLNLDSILVSPGYSPSKRIVHPPEVEIAYDIFYISDSCVIGATTQDLGRMFRWNPLTDEIKLLDFSPKISPMPEQRLGYLYYSRNGIKPDNTMIVSALENFQRIYILDTNLEVLRTISFPNAHKPTWKNGELTDHDGTYVCYKRVFCTNKYIYALYNGVPDVEEYDNYNAQEVQVFDWSGNPIHVYSLDINVKGIYVDEERNILYGLNRENDQALVKFDLNQSSLAIN